MEKLPPEHMKKDPPKGTFLHFVEPGVYLPDAVLRKEEYQIFVEYDGWSAIEHLLRKKESIDGVILGLAIPADKVAGVKADLAARGIKPKWDREKYKVPKEGDALIPFITQNLGLPVLWYSQYYGKDERVRPIAAKRVSVAEVGDYKKVLSWLEKYASRE